MIEERVTVVYSEKKGESAERENKKRDPKEKIFVEEGTVPREKSTCPKKKRRVSVCRRLHILQEHQVV